jgi:hypothetical protein
MEAVGVALGTVSLFGQIFSGVVEGMYISNNTM